MTAKSSGSSRKKTTRKRAPSGKTSTRRTTSAAPGDVLGHDPLAWLNGEAEPSVPESAVSVASSADAGVETGSMEAASVNSEASVSEPLMLEEQLNIQRVAELRDAWWLASKHRATYTSMHQRYVKWTARVCSYWLRSTVHYGRAAMPFVGWQFPIHCARVPGRSDWATFWRWNRRGSRSVQ